MKNTITKKDIVGLLKELKNQIDDDYRAFDDDEIPGMQVTIGYDDKTGKWNYQTGDNSYSGGAYGFPHWAVIGLYRDSNVKELTDDIINQINDSMDN